MTNKARRRMSDAEQIIEKFAESIVNDAVGDKIHRMLQVAMKALKNFSVADRQWVAHEAQLAAAEIERIAAG